VRYKNSGDLHYRNLGPRILPASLPTAHVVELPNASHFVFLSNEADVLREIRDFVAGLN
jgi:pimeloyl-ACP methyl ester carboxylesterase